MGSGTLAGYISEPRQTGPLARGSAPPPTGKSYQALRWLSQQYGIQWIVSVDAWLKAVAEVLDMLRGVLCPDVVASVECYC